MVSMVTPGQPGAWEVLRGSPSCSFCPPPFWGPSPFGAPLWELGLLTPPDTDAPLLPGSRLCCPRLPGLSLLPRVATRWPGSEIR